MLTVTKFGGSSLATALRVQRAVSIIRQDPSRRVVVVSAPGRRSRGDRKITDLLCLCSAQLQSGGSCADIFAQIRARFAEICTGCGLGPEQTEELDALAAHLGPGVQEDWLLSRGEYLTAKLLAELLGFRFVDAAAWLRFDEAGRVDLAAAARALRACAEGRPVVLPGFYGAMPDGTIRTFPRGGSDITGAIAAAALQADLYENWTDVPGVLSADPALTQAARPLRQMRYDQLELLSALGAQVLHESAVAPIREAGVPLVIRSTVLPDMPGTYIAADSVWDARDPSACFAVRPRGAKGSLYRALPGADSFTVIGAVCRTQEAQRIILSAAGQSGLLRGSVSLDGYALMAVEDADVRPMLDVCCRAAQLQ